MKIILRDRQARHPVGSIHEVKSIVPHGGHYDDACQYVLEDGTHVRESAAEILSTLPLPSTPEQTTSEPLREAQDRSERNWRVARLFVRQMGGEGRANNLLAGLKRELAASGGHCGEGTFECAQRRCYEADLEQAIRIIEGVS